jgi:hypothetical protein
MHAWVSQWDNGLQHRVALLNYPRVRSFIGGWVGGWAGATRASEYLQWQCYDVYLC